MHDSILGGSDDDLGLLDSGSTEGRASWASTPAVRRAMQGNKGRDTRPELAVRRLVHAQGLRYRVSIRPLAGFPRTADLVFTRARVAVFVDGCFWHGCPEHYRASRTNTEFWALKISRNQARDKETNETLLAAGWVVLRFWSHESPARIARSVEQAVRHV
jgi:DNA mismatch endonuclease (patch repair protein)